MAEDCVSRTIAAIPEADRKDVEALYNAMSDMRKAAFLEGMSNPNSKFAEKAKNMLEGFRRGVMVEKIKTLENIKKRARNEAFITNPAFKDRAQGIRAILGGTFENLEGGRRSVGVRSKAMRNVLFSSLLRDMGDNKALLDIFKSDALEREIMMEIEQLSKTGGKPGVSGSSEAMQIAKAVHNANKMELRILNDAGAFINDLDGYIMRQSHDSQTIKNAGYEKWRDFIISKLDHEKTFNRDFYKVNPAEYLREVYDELVEGRPKVLQGADSDSVIKIIGTPSNMARRVEQGRKLHFNDAASFYEYNKEFGKKSLNEQVISSISSTARSAALMEAFGTNPRAAFERLASGLDKAEMQRLERYWANVDGSADMPGNNPAAKYSQNVRSWVSMAKMGASTIGSLADVTTRAAVLQVNGKNLFSAHLESITGLLSSLPHAKQAEAAKLLSVGADSRIGDMFDRFGEGGPSGWVAKASDVYFKLNGLRAWTDANKASQAQLLSANLGMNLGKDFSSLDAPLGRTLTGYGIGPVEWEMMRAASSIAEDTRFVGYGDVSRLTNETVEQIMRRGGMIKKENAATRRQVERYKNDVSSRLAEYYNDQVSISMNEPGVREKAEVLNRGTLKGTVAGEGVRFAAQFKSYPVTMVTQFWDMYDKTMLADKTIMGKAGAVAPLFISALTLGYISNSAIALVRGKSPPDPHNPKTWMEAAVRGGFAGIYGDFLLGEFDSRHGRSALSAIAGPVFGQFDDMMDLYSSMIRPDDGGKKTKLEKGAAATFRMILNNTPGQNLFYLKAGMDYLILNEINETLNPGYLKRMQTRMKKEGQEFIMDEQQADLF